MLLFNYKGGNMKKLDSKIITLYIDKDIYKNYQMYALMIDKSVSSLIEEHMKETVKNIKKGKM
jgi:hypothetical protein